MRPTTRIELAARGALVVIDTPDGDIAKTVILESRKGARVATITLTSAEAAQLADALEVK